MVLKQFEFNKDFFLFLIFVVNCGCVLEATVDY
jgi:hypothetical protein